MANKFVKSFNFGGEDNYFPLSIVGAEHEGMVMKVVDGEWSVSELFHEPEITIINFIINDEGELYNCQAYEGMTWYEWINSSYYTEGPVSHIDIYCTSAAAEVGVYGWDHINGATGYVIGTDVITAGYKYDITATVPDL